MALGEYLKSQGWILLDLSAKEEGWIRGAGEAQILIVRSRTRVTRELLDRCPSLLAVGRAGTGTDNIDTEALEEKGIALLTTPGANSQAVVEHTWALILGALRWIGEAHRSMREGRWEKSRFQGREASGKTLGVVGLGRIGRGVAELGLSFGMRVAGTDPFVTPKGAGLTGVKGMNLNGLLGCSDVVTLHLPLDDTTRHFLNEGTLRQMKRGALLVNSARGGLIDEEALVKVLDEGYLLGAALDVFEGEPEVHPKLRMHPRVLATPHIAGSTEEAQERVGIELARSLSKWWDRRSGE
jgi:D-3-phosphoglycerate dehydrogenase